MITSRDFNFLSLNGMEENTQLDPKTEQGNGQNGTDDSKVSITREEYERLQWVERDYKASTREAQQLRAISECGADERAFVKYYNNDKKLAERIAKHYGRGTADELMTQLKEKYGENIQTPISNDEIKSTARQEVQEELAQAELDGFIKAKWLKKWEKSYSRFMNEYQDLMDGKAITKENVQKASQKARKLIMDENVDLAWVPTSWGWKGGNGTTVIKEQPQSIFEMYKKK